ncbi:hypothetical protein DFJ74DRAFT_759204 [Hyaloraphidium curvatum]|nr:hypothetical protein DFJ74DRAFT_759204 [Hyaloraphidium curvatum]
MGDSGVHVYLALRFHVNFYHSYRGDSLDDKGIGKDIRIIRKILDTLDKLEAEGFPVRCAWDIENYYSLELYMPKHAPDIIERIRARVAAGKDEVEPMSYNNGLATAHDLEELKAAIGAAISNPAKSGLKDVFGTMAPILRPQECCWNSSQIVPLTELGIEAVSLYYSAIPFNGFGSFVPPLPLEQRYNPIRVVDPDTGKAMRLLPCYNPGDVVEHNASLRGWLKSVRKEQMRSKAPKDLLLLLDMDADDDFWEGYHESMLPAFLKPLGILPASLRGLGPLVRSLKGLPWLRFALPGEYLKAHPDEGELSLGQDIADGSFDGYSSWSEKEDNARLWTVIHAARKTARLARRLAEDSGAGVQPELAHVLDEALRLRLLAMSTTHFGMASPVMNAERLVDAFRSAEAALKASERALEMGRTQVAGAEPPESVWFFDDRIDGLRLGSGAIGRDAAGKLRLLNPPSSKCFVAEVAPAPGSTAISNGRISLVYREGAGVTATLDGKEIFAAPLSRPWITHTDRTRVGRVLKVEVEAAPGFRELVLSGEIVLPRSGAGGSDTAAKWTHRYCLADGVPTIRVDVSVDYPKTERLGYDKKRASRLARDWDARWSEVVPFEMEPAIGATPDRPARVWKEDFTGRVSSYELNYHTFGPNREPDSLNNQITDGWVAVSGPAGGLLVAQSDEAEVLFAFCPMRVRMGRGGQRVLLNPFGSYNGKQWRYPTATTGLGRLAALAGADNLDPYAPSWEGGKLRAALYLVPYAGDRPPDAVRRDALVFAYTPAAAREEKKG